MKILFLEDEPTIQDVLSEYMKMQQYEVTCVCDGEEALEALQTQNFDMAVLDIMVPKKSGLEVLEFIKEKREDMATIMLTALDDGACGSLWKTGRIVSKILWKSNYYFGEYQF